MVEDTLAPCCDKPFFKGICNSVKNDPVKTRMLMSFL